MPLLTLLVQLIPSLISLSHVAEAAHPDAGQGAAKMDFITQILTAVCSEIPSLAPQAAAIIAITKAVISIYVKLSNIFGWSPKVAQIAAELSGDTQAPAPVEDATPTPVAAAG